MTFDEYQKKALKTAISNPNEVLATLHWVLGINGEAGEVAEKVKKIIRDKDGVISNEDKKELAKEVGDVLWYLAVFSHHLGISFESIAKENLTKLKSRHTRGALKGSGDNR
ncbi:MAG TPA: nucleoside triphosphate pyrophosphohydrolase family protein [Patescibacteria group bacterium]|nr:nucleoside triphosphate pyrophosphohydrolase family protein [Patescibacteria group bacterium]